MENGVAARDRAGLRWCYTGLVLHEVVMWQT
jgi:hypothetical protein